MFRTDPVRVSVPATSANLGPGFDSLGLALAWYDDVTAQIGGTGVRVTVEGEGAGEVPTDEGHLVAATMLATFVRLGLDRPAGLVLRAHNRIPHARGLGSSSAAIVAGILLARGLVGPDAPQIDAAAALRLAAEFEGHPDNVAPCLLGGFTIAWTEPSGGREGSKTSGARAVRLTPAPAVRPVVLIPDKRALTTQARAALPTSVPHEDAAYNAGRAALLVHALTTAPDLLLEATEDRLHQGYRAPGMPETAALVRRLRETGVAAVVSGAGPSVLALLTEDDQADRLPVPDGWWSRSLSLAERGARMVMPGHADGGAVAAGLPS